MNPTVFTCYIFQGNNKNFNKVGLSISATNKKQAQKSLRKIKKMQPDSWLVYNNKSQ